MSPRDKQVLGAIYDYRVETGTEPRAIDLLPRLAMCEQTLWSALARLEAEHWIENRVKARHRLRVRRMPGGGLTWGELQWCQRHADRVLALMDVVRSSELAP